MEGSHYIYGGSSVRQMKARPDIVWCSNKWKHVQTGWRASCLCGSSSQAVCFTHCHQAPVRKRNHHCLHSSMSLSIFVDWGNITLGKYSMTFCFSTPARQLGLCWNMFSNESLHVFEPRQMCFFEYKIKGSPGWNWKGKPKIVRLFQSVLKSWWN